MPLVYSRRRLLALAAAATAWPLSAFAQKDASPPRIVDGAAIRDLGSWHIVTQALNGRAWPLDSAVTVSGYSVKNGNLFEGGSAELLIEYWGGGGPRSGFFPVLKINIAGNLSTRKPARLVVDGNEIGKYDVERNLALDLSQVFPGLGGLQAAKLIQVYMPIEGKEALVYEVKPTDTANVMATMRQGPDAFARSQPQRPSGSSKPGDCFITTACCEVIGLRDDCFELRALRRFRDGPLAATADGRRDVETYYELAPRIVAEIRRRGEERRLLSEYAFAILPSALAARLGLVALPRRLYSRMMRRMMARYLG
ncbi:hypothetical protein BH10PSE9_BH10PSE9_21840 [soil metagenome]